MLTTNLVQLKTMPGMFGFELFQQLAELLETPCNMKEVINEHLVSCQVLLDEGLPVGRFAIYENKKLRYQNKPAICIGAYACIDDDFVANKLLEHAVEICKELGYQQVIGPMHGSTWNRYRFKTSHKKNSFFLDVNNLGYYDKQFEKAGFSKIGKYLSNLDDQLKCDANQLEKFKKHYEKKGAMIRNINMSDLKNELGRLADFCNLAFANNFLFTPIERKAFVKKYMALGALMDSRFIWIVEDEGKEIQAVCFAIRDVTDTLGETIIIKTIGVRPGTRFRGIATYLCRNLIQFSRQLGYKRIIHALIFEDNISLNASEKYGHTFCEYALYGKTIKSKK